MKQQQLLYKWVIANEAIRMEEKERSEGERSGGGKEKVERKYVGWEGINRRNNSPGCWRKDSAFLEQSLKICIQVFKVM